MREERKGAQHWSRETLAFQGHFLIVTGGTGIRDCSRGLINCARTVRWRLLPIPAMFM